MSPERDDEVHDAIFTVEQAKRFLIDLAMGVTMWTDEWDGKQYPPTFMNYNSGHRAHSPLRAAVTILRDQVIKRQVTIQLYYNNAIIVEYEPAGPVTLGEPVAAYNAMPHIRYGNNKLRDFAAHLLRIAGEREFTQEGN